MASESKIALDRETYRPEELADMLGVSGKIVRAYLRTTFARPIEVKGTTWTLSKNAAQQTVDHFLARRTNVVTTVADVK